MHDRLPFLLPPFCRVAWVSDRAQDLWMPRIRAVRRAWRASAIDSVGRARSAALLPVAPSQLDDLAAVARSKGLRTVNLPTLEDARPEPGGAEADPVLVAFVSDGASYRITEAWLAKDHGAVGELLGYPACCIDFFMRVGIAERRIDTTWPSAAASTTAALVERGRIELAGDTPAGNILLREVGIRGVFHLPCAFDCHATRDLGAALMNRLRITAPQEAGWLLQILSWPLSWSALHGIAQTVSPVFKLAVRTDATAGRHEIRYLGQEWPECAPQGTAFPFRPPTRPATASTRYARGVELISSAEYLDNGFSTRGAMDHAHDGLVAALQLAKMPLTGRRLVDLGCGSGALLRRLRVAFDAQVVGVEARHEVVARALHRDSSMRIYHCDIADVESWTDSSGPYDLAIVSANRLTDTSLGAAALTRISSTARSVLIYSYDRGIGLTDLMAAGAAEADLEQLSSSTWIWRRSE